MICLGGKFTWGGNAKGEPDSEEGEEREPHG